MKILGKIAPAVLALCLMFEPCEAAAQNEPAAVRTEGGSALITLLAGEAHLVREDESIIRPLRQGDALNEHDRVATGKASRIELRLPDQSYIRLDEASVFVLQSAGYDANRRPRRIDVTMMLGKIWAKVARFLNREDRFAIATHTAVAGVRGTTYRMNVEQDRSVMIKVYGGEVQVRSAQAQANGPAPPPRLGAPTPVPGPHPIPGPHPVTMEQWTYIVGAMQQINIAPDGTPSPPFNFSPEADMDDWVRWNRERDR